MFKKFISYLTLICFINSYCVQNVLAMIPEEEVGTLHTSLKVKTNTKGEYVLDESTFNNTKAFDIDLIHNDNVVGALTFFNGNLSLRGFTNNSFYLENLPEGLNSLKIKLGGSVKIEKKILCKHQIKLKILDSALLMDGFHVESDLGSAIFTANNLGLNGDSYTKAIKLRNVKQFVIQRKSSLGTDFLKTEGAIDTFKVLGKLSSQVTQLDDMANVTCDGAVDFGQGILKADAISNKGKLKAAIIVPQKTWYNGSKGEVTVTDSLHAIVDDYKDDGITSVYGLATINAERGRITNSFLARNARIAFKNTLSLPKDSRLLIQDHLMLHSGKNLELYGDVLSKNFDEDWPTLEITPSLREKLRNLNKGGWFFTAIQDIVKKGNVKVNARDIIYSAGGRYNGIQGSTRAGFFQNSITIMSESAKLADEMRSYNNLTLSVRKLTELMGSRKVEDLFILDTGQLKQHAGDVMEAGILLGRAEEAILSGTVGIKNGMSLQVKEKFKSTESFQLKAKKGAPVAIKGDSTSVHLGGKYQDAAFQVDAKELVYNKSYRGQLSASYAKADTILHETGSHHKVAGTNIEDAKKGIAVDKDAVVQADNNIFKAGSWIFNAGNIESASQYLADTALHLNMFGGRIKAHHNLIYADLMNLNYSGSPSQLMTNNAENYLFKALNYLSPELMNMNCFKAGDENSNLFNNLSAISGNFTEINTALNLNGLSLIRGTESLKVNALINANAGFYLSRNATVNIFWDAPCYGITAFDPGGILEPEALLENISLSSLVNPALTLMGRVATGDAIFWIKTAQFAWNASGLVKAGYQLWNVNNKNDEDNYWRLSRMVKRTGEYTGLAIQGYQTYKEARDTFCPEKHKKTPVEKEFEEKDSPETPEKKDPLENDNKEADLKQESENFMNRLEYLATLENLWNTSNIVIPGTRITNSVFGGGNGFNVMPHIIQRSVYLNDNSRNLAIDRIVKAYTGRDQSTTLAQTNNVSTASDFEYAAKVTSLQNSVLAGGDLKLDKEMDVSSDTNQFKSDGKMTSEEGSKAQGKNNSFEAEGDLLFKSTVTAEAGPNAVRIISYKGNATFCKEGRVNLINPNQSQEQSSPSTQEGKSDLVVIVTGETGAEFEGKIISEAKGQNTLIHSNGKTTIKTDSEITTPGANVTFSGVDTVVEKGSVVNAASEVVRGTESYIFGGTSYLTQEEKGLMFSGKGIITSDAHVVIKSPETPTVDTEHNENMAELDANDHPARQEEPTTNPASAEQPAKHEEGMKDKDDTSDKKHRAKKGSNLPKIKPSKLSCGKRKSSEKKHHKTKSLKKNNTKAPKNNKSQEALAQPQAEPTSEPQIQPQDESNHQPQPESQPVIIPNPDKWSVYFDGPAKIEGFFDVPLDVIATDYPKSEDNKPTGQQEQDQQPKSSYILGPNLHIKTHGNFFVMGQGTVEQENSSFLEVKNGHLHGDAGTRVDGKNRSQENFLASSNKDVIEGDNADTKAGGDIYFYAKGRMIKKEGARTDGMNVLRHGEKGGECAGNLDAKNLATFTIDQGKLVIADLTTVRAPQQVIGSFQNSPEEEEDLPGQKNDENKDMSQEDAKPQKQITTENKDGQKKEPNKHKKNPHRKGKSINPNLPSRSQYPPKIDRAMPKKVKEEAQPEKQEVPKPESNLAPISEAGVVEIGKGVKFIGKSLTLRGRGVEHILDLFTQAGYFEGVDITDYIYAHTDQDVTFGESMTSKSKGFELHTDQIRVLKNVVLNAPEILKLHSTKENLFLGYNTTLGANVYLEVMSDKDIVGGFKKKIVHHKNGTETVKFKGVNLLGGSGLEYTYIDPKTGEKSQRLLGLNIDANGKVFATGMKLSAPGDVRIHGFEDIINKGASQLYVKKIKEESNLWRDKTKIFYETEFFMPSAVTNGNLIVSSENGGLLWEGGEFIAKDGADLLLNGHVQFLPLKGKRGHTTERETLITFADSYDKTVHGLAESTLFVNQGTTEVRIWTSQNHDIIAPGFTYIGEKGTLDMKGRWGYFTRPILKHSSNSSSTHGYMDYSLLNHWKSLQALRYAKDLAHNINQENWMDSFKDVIKPSVTAGIDWTSGRRNWESLGTGYIYTKDWVVNFSKGIIMDNAYGLTVIGDFYPENLPYWHQGGANLHYSSKSNSFGIFAGFNDSGFNVGFRFAHSKTKGNCWVPGNINIGTFHGKVGHITQSAAHMDIHTMDGRIDRIDSYTRQDHSHTSGYGGSIAWNFSGQPTANGNAYFNHSRQTNHQSGIHVKHATKNASIGKADLIGAKITGITPDSQTYTPLPDDYNIGGSLGFCGNASGLNAVQLGVSRNGNSIQLNLTIPQDLQDKSKSNAEPWRQIGSVIVNGIELPIITSINPEFFQQFGNDLSQLGQKIVDSASNLVQPPVADLRQPENFEEVTFKRFQEEGEVMTSLENDIPFADEITKPVFEAPAPMLQNDSAEAQPVHDQTSSQGSHSKVADEKSDQQTQNIDKEKEQDVWEEVDPLWATFNEDKITQEGIIDGIGDLITKANENINKNSVGIPVVTTDPPFPIYEENKLINEFFANLYAKGKENYEKNSLDVPEATTDYDNPAYDELFHFWHAPQPYFPSLKDNLAQNIEDLNELALWDKNVRDSFMSGDSPFWDGIRYGLYMIANNGEKDTILMEQAKNATELHKNFPESNADAVWIAGAEIAKILIETRLKLSNRTTPSPSLSPARLLRADQK